jgi:ABC-type transport system involved in multi-copper enzyme maturation permease subunit
VKGLLYKEWCLGKKRFFVYLLLAVLLSVLGILVSLSYQFGNLQGKDAADVRMFFYIPYLILLFSAELCLQSVYRDYESGWMKYSYTMPLALGKAVGARYLTCMLLLVFSFVYTLVYSVILGAVSTISYRAGDLKNQLLLLAVACLLIGVFLPMAFHFQTGRIVSAIAVGLLVVSYMGIGVAMMTGMENGVNPSEFIEKAKVMQNRGMLIGLPVAAVVIAISFLCSCRIYGRRERV